LNRQLSLIIAIDGPAASGKGTLARRLAEKYRLPHLDTGLTYRALAKALIDRSLPLGEEAVAVKTARKIDLAKLDREILAAHDIGEGASKVAVIPAVRRILVEKQRAFANQPGGAVLDGRDIGTVVCPDALVKLYVTASAEVRAKRRFDEELMRAGDADYETILEDVERRDARDIGRTDSPLKPAQDAHLLDTSAMDIETAFRKAVSIIDGKLALQNKQPFLRQPHRAGPPD
jgi:CMP/dCMP kinase